MAGQVAAEVARLRAVASRAAFPNCGEVGYVARYAKTVKDLIAELELRVGRIGLIVNRLQGELAPESQAVIDSMGVPLLGTIPSDDLIFRYDTEGKPLFTLPEESSALRAAFGIFDSLDIP